jgi:hypothetical protein
VFSKSPGIRAPPPPITGAEGVLNSGHSPGRKQRAELLARPWRYIITEAALCFFNRLARPPPHAPITGTGVGGRA